MTPFMIRVAELVGADLDDVEEVDQPLAYRTRLSASVPANLGADRHVAIRALAEQLLCEANAVLADSDDRMGLFDEVADGELAFSVTYRGRLVRFSTRFVDGKAYARLMGDGVEPGPDRELASPEDVADLLLLLLGTAGVTHHPVQA